MNSSVTLTASNIPYARQSLNQDDINSVIDVLRSDFLTQGPVGLEFEKTTANYCRAKYAVAASNATCALHLACLALEVSEGDIVWTSPITFVASANCVLYCRASIDFVDIDPRTYNLSVAALSDKLATAEKLGKLPKVVITVHFSGQSCDMESIYKLGKQYGFRIIEDASHAIGGSYLGEPIGNGRYSDITVFSFHPVKIITTGEGGMALTNNEQLAKKMRLLRGHGITNSPTDMNPTPQGEIWNYQQIDLGFNYRMTDIQAALGLSQLKRLDKFVENRQALAKRYDKLLSSLPIIKPWQDPKGKSSFHLYIIRLKLNEMVKSHREVFEELISAGILVNLHYIPVYRHPYYQNMGFKSGYCPQAERYYAEAISLPMYSELTEGQQDRVASILQETIN